MTMDKQLKKRVKGKCCFCGNSDYGQLDVHRIEPGSKYTDWGTLIICSNCHRAVHNGKIVILGKHPSTKGHLINYLENNEEKWAEC